MDNPPEGIIFKSLEVLAKITVPVDGEIGTARPSSISKQDIDRADRQSPQYPMTDANALFALEVLDSSRRQSLSRDRQVFTALIRLHAHNHQLVSDLSRVIQYMCTLQPPEFVFVSFALELDHFVNKQVTYHSLTRPETKVEEDNAPQSLSADLEFVSAFVQQMNHVLLNTEETKELRQLLKDCVSSKIARDNDHRKARLFHILLHSFSHNLASTISLCLWGGAYRTASTFLNCIDPLDINLIFLVEVDKLVEMLERPLFRHLHVRMLETDKNPSAEGSGNMLFRTLKSLLMLVPQSTCYRILRDRLTTVSRFRQSALVRGPKKPDDELSSESESFVSRVIEVRTLHCDAMWETIRAGSLETAARDDRNNNVEIGESRREWLGYSSKQEEDAARARYQAERIRLSDGLSIEEIKEDYHGFESMGRTNVKRFFTNKNAKQTKTSEQGTSESQNPTAAEGVERQPSDEMEWKEYWERADAEE